MDKLGHVLILGAGFGGRDAAAKLARLLPRDVHITLIDRNPYMLYTPMLTEVAGRSVSPQHIQAPTRSLPRRVHFVEAEIETADLQSKVVTLVDGRTVRADHILFALGSTTNFRDVPGAEQHSLTMKTLDDARRARTLAQRRVRQAAVEKDAEMRRHLLTFTVAGGGYTGVETIAALNDLVRDTAAEVGISPHELQVGLVEPAKRLMAEMPEELASYAEHRLGVDGVQVQIGTGVEEVGPAFTTLNNGTRIPTGMLIWDTGIQPNPLLKSLDCPKGKKGGFEVDSAFQLQGYPGVWAIGDCAEIPKPDGSGSFYEPTAQNATRQGQHVAMNIARTIRGQNVQPFRYKQVGELALISRRRGVAYVFGLKVSGVPAWLLWRAIYLVKMPGLGQRLGILLDWLRLAFGRQYVPVSRRLPAASVTFSSRHRGAPGAVHKELVRVATR